MLLTKGYVYKCFTLFLFTLADFITIVVYNTKNKTNIFGYIKGVAGIGVACVYMVVKTITYSNPAL